MLASPRYGERRARHWIDVCALCRNARQRRRPAAAQRLALSRLSDSQLQRPTSPTPASFRNRWPATPSGRETAMGRLRWAFGRGALGRKLADGHHRRHGRQTDRPGARPRTASSRPRRRSFCGATVHYARCHNHKFDPIKSGRLLQPAGRVCRGRSGTAPPFDADLAVATRPPDLLARHKSADRLAPRPSGSPSTAPWRTELTTLEKELAG